MIPLPPEPREPAPQPASVVEGLAPGQDDRGGLLGAPLVRTLTQAWLVTTAGALVIAFVSPWDSMSPIVAWAVAVLLGAALVAAPGALLARHRLRNRGARVRASARVAAVAGGLIAGAAGAGSAYAATVMGTGGDGLLSAEALVAVVMLTAGMTALAAGASGVAAGLWPAPRTSSEPAVRLGQSWIAPAVVLVALGALLSPTMACGCGERPRVFVLKTDLRNLVSTQEAFLAEHGRYARSWEELGATLSAEVAVADYVGRDSAWAITLRDERGIAPMCGVGVGVPNPITQEEPGDSPRCAGDGPSP